MPRRIMEGKVVSTKCAKTLTVLVERRVKDPLYGKVIKRSAKYAAHDESGQWRDGDWVRIEECAPISKRKKWRVLDGKSMGLSQAKTIDDVDAGRKTVKKADADNTAEAEQE